MVIFLEAVAITCHPFRRHRCLLAFAIFVLPLMTTARTAHAFDFFRDVGKSIEKSAQDVGKSVEKGAQDVGKPFEKTFPETEQSPSDPCQVNNKLPQCDLDKVEK